MNYHIVTPDILLSYSKANGNFVVTAPSINSSYAVAKKELLKESFTTTNEIVREILRDCEGVFPEKESLAEKTPVENSSLWEKFLKKIILFLKKLLHEEETLEKNTSGKNAISVFITPIAREEIFLIWESIVY